MLHLTLCSSWNVRLQCIETLSSFGKDAVTAIPAIAEATKDERREVRAAASKALSLLVNPEKEEDPGCRAPWRLQTAM
jgi:hypothetical protein